MINTEKCIYHENYRNYKSITHIVFLKFIMIRLVLEGKLAAGNTNVPTFYCN